MSDRPWTDAPSFASPILHPIAHSEGSQVRLVDLSGWSKLVVKAAPGADGGLDVPFGSSSIVGEVIIAGSRPGEWTVIGEWAEATTVVAGVEDNVVDLTHGRAMIELAGPSAAPVLEKLCSIDWSDDMMPDGAVVSATVAKVGCDFVRRDRDERPAYLVLVDRSYGQYLFDMLADAATESRSRRRGQRARGPRSS